MNASKAVQRPREAGGMNSHKVPAATTNSAPRPMPMIKRKAISQLMLGTKHAAIDAMPKISRLV